MTASMFALLWVFFALICTRIRADFSIEDGGEVVGSDRSDSSAFKVELDQLRSKIHQLESHIEGKSQELKTKDDLIAQKEKGIQEKSDSIAFLQNEVSSLQVDELEKELKTQEKEKDVLNARASEAEKKVKELNSKLEDRYIMTSYFEKYESLDDTNFQEFISHGLPFGSCESLQSNTDLLRLSVPQRLLIGEGSHRHLSSSIKFHIEPESVSQLSSHFCEVLNLLIIERLPTSSRAGCVHQCSCFWRYEFGIAFSSF